MHEDLIRRAALRHFGILKVLGRGGDAHEHMFLVSSVVWCKLASATMSVEGT